MTVNFFRDKIWLNKIKVGVFNVEIKNDEENLLIDNEQSNKPERICIKWKDFNLKNKNNEGDGNYYCY